jgi:transposase
MAGKIKTMSQIKQLLLMHRQGLGKKSIAAALGMSKNTVKSYLQKVGLLLHTKGASDTLDSLVSLEDPVLEARLHAGNPAYKDDIRYEKLQGIMEYLLSQLPKKGVTKHLLWEEYRHENPLGYGYSQFCWHLQQYQKVSKPTAVLTHLPADKLYIDFAGKPLSYVDRETGECIPCQVFVACLPYSDYSFAMAVRSQKTEDLVMALQTCLQQLGGVPHALVPDNLKAAVIKSSKYEPGINQILEDFANHYGTTVIPARAAKPQDKALVENQVKLIYSRVYAKLRNRQFFDLHSLNEALREKVHAHNQTRMQKKPWSRQEKFLAEERHLLDPLPAEAFEIKKYKELTVAKNGHIYLSENKNYYSVPYRLMGQKVKVIYTPTRVHIYHRGEQVAVHLRSYKAAQYVTQDTHLASQHKHYRDRSPEYYIKKAGAVSDTLKALIVLLFTQDKHPEQLYKSCDGLLRLAWATPALTLEKACQTALENKVYSYTFLKNIIENKMADQPQEVAEKPLPKHPNVRGSEYYQTQLNFTSNESN